MDEPRSWPAGVVSELALALMRKEQVAVGLGAILAALSSGIGDVVPKLHNTEVPNLSANLAL